MCYVLIIYLLVIIQYVTTLAQEHRTDLNFLIYLLFLQW